MMIRGIWQQIGILVVSANGEKGERLSKTPSSRTGFQFLRNLAQKGFLVDIMGYEVAPDMRSFLRPKQTVLPPMRSRRNDANVIQKAGEVTVTTVTSGSFATWCFTKAYSAISQAKAISVMNAARNEVNEDRRVTVTCCENDIAKAMKVTAVATGWIASPRVQEEPIMTDTLSEFWSATR